MRARAEEVRDRVRDAVTSLPAHSFSPSAIRDACQRSSVSTIPAIQARIRSASPRWLPLNRSGRCTLRIQKRRRDTRRARARQKRSTRKANQPWRTEPRQRRVLRDGADQRHQDRREEDEEAPEDERVDQARGRAAGTASSDRARRRPRCARAATRRRTAATACPAGRASGATAFGGRTPRRTRPGPPRERGRKGRCSWVRSTRARHGLAPTTPSGALPRLRAAPRAGRRSRRSPPPT